MAPHRPPPARHSGSDLGAERLAAELAGIGPYFTYSTRRPAAVRGAPWRSIGELLDGSAGLEQHYRQVQATLGKMSGRAVDLRVAASTGHFALVSRLLCPAVGAASLGFGLDLAEGWWQPATSGPLPLCLPEGSAEDVADPAIWTGAIAALTLATAAFSVSYRVLDGNIASAVNGAAATICSARPDLAARAMAVARQLSPDAGPAFRRRSCCLIYRIASTGPGNYCGDCILTTSHRAVS